MRNLNDIHNNKIPPIPPAPPLTPPCKPYRSHPAIPEGVEEWQPWGMGYALNDLYSKQVRRDTLRFRIERQYRMG